MADNPSKKTRVKAYTRRGPKTPKGGRRWVKVKEHARATRKGEFAPGIPEQRKIVPPPKIKHPQHWRFALQAHAAKKRGPHLDLRLGSRGKAYSWVPAKWPKPGEWVYAVEQPTHTQEYMGWEGTIPEGYGAGDVRLARHGVAIVQESGPKKVNFTIIDGRKTEDLSLVRMGGRIWRLINTTTPEEKVQPYQYKPKYKSLDVEKVEYDDPSTIMKAKIDGAHGLSPLQGGKRAKVYSYREPKAGGYIEWTHKIPGMFSQKVPASFGDTLVRVEVYAKDKKGQALPVNEVSGMLNAGVLKSRQMQKEKGRLVPALIDVIKWKGQGKEDAPGEEKERILRTIQKAMPIFDLPDTAESTAEKKVLLDSIKAGTHPQTDEGVVEIPKGPGQFVKRKIRPDIDVYIRGFTAAKKGTKYEGRAVGGFLYSYTADGPIIGTVGTGMTDKLREEMYNDPQKFVGRVARTKGQKFKTGTGRTLSFIGWHMDKGPIGGYTQHELVPVEKVKR